MCPAVQRYLRFCNAPTSSPWQFTKLLRPLVHLLHLQGVCLHVYLDDWLIWVDSSEMSSHAQLVIWKLCHLGWMINFQKSELTLLGILSSSRCIFGPKNSPWPPAKDADQGSSNSRPLMLGDNSVSVRRVQNAGHYSVHKAPLVPRGQLHFSKEITASVDNGL